jgi:hypothetical protein
MIKIQFVESFDGRAWFDEFASDTTVALRAIKMLPAFP